MHRQNSSPEADSISVVIPVYRSAASLVPLHARLTTVLRTVASDHEVIFVEDGGHDDSWQVIQSLVDACSWVRGIRLSRNHGQHNALLCGVRAARHSIIVTMDDDLQHPPEEIPRLMNELRNGFDVVYGVPKREQHGFWRDKASILTKIALMSAMGAQTARHVSSFRVFRTPLRETFANYRSPFVFIDVLLTWGTTRFTHLKVKHEPRTLGASNYSFGKLVAHAMNMMTGFSTFPLQVASFMGFACALIGILLLFYLVLQFFVFGRSVPGFYFLASIITLFAGAQLFTLGVIGEYLARMYLRSLDKPTYSIAEVTAGETMRPQSSCKVAAAEVC